MVSLGMNPRRQLEAEPDESEKRTDNLVGSFDFTCGFFFAPCC